jgi:hypothetical protein
MPDSIIYAIKEKMQPTPPYFSSRSDGGGALGSANRGKCKFWKSNWLVRASWVAEVELHIVKVGDDLVNARWWFCSGLFGEYCLDEQIVWFKEQHLIGLVSSKSARMNGAIVAKSLTVNHDAMTFKFIYVNTVSI